MNVLIKPIITEKMTAESELYNRYGFYVDPRANKIQIKDAVEKAYNVSVKKVRTMNYGPTRKSSIQRPEFSTARRMLLKRPSSDVVEGDNDFYSNL